MCEEVVVIDDSPVSRLVVEIALRRQGVSCRCFANGTEALRALEEDPQLIPRVIVMELLPQSAGDRRPRARPAAAGLPQAG